jgi:putative hydrolase of the HAD superfamily
MLERYASAFPRRRSRICSITGRPLTSPKKPAPEIFRADADPVGASLDGAWMIGDSAHADIRGAVGVGARSVWVSGDRPWPDVAYRPTRVTPDTAAAIRHVTAAPR